MRGQVRVTTVARPRVSLVSALSLTSPVSRPREKSTGPFLWIKLTPSPAEHPSQTKRPAQRTRPSSQSSEPDQPSRPINCARAEPHLTQSTSGPAEPPTQSHPQRTPSALLRLHAWRFFAGQVEEISVNPLEPVDDGPEDNDVVA